MATDTDRAIAAGLSVFDKDDEAGRNGFIAQQSAHAERTEEGVWTMPMSEATRDRVVFYGRQDTGHALLNTISLLAHAKAIRRSLKLLNVILVVVAALLAFIAWRLA